MDVNALWEEAREEAVKYGVTQKQFMAVQQNPMMRSMLGKMMKSGGVAKGAGTLNRKGRGKGIKARMREKLEAKKKREKLEAKKKKEAGTREVDEKVGEQEEKKKETEEDVLMRRVEEGKKLLRRPLHYLFSSTEEQRDVSDMIFALVHLDISQQIEDGGCVTNRVGAGVARVMEESGREAKLFRRLAQLCAVKGYKTKERAATCVSLVYKMALPMWRVAKIIGAHNLIIEHQKTGSTREEATQQSCPPTV